MAKRTDLKPDLSRLDVMEVLKIGNATYYKLVNSGALRAYRVSPGGSIRVTWEALEEFRRQNVLQPKDCAA